MNQSKTTFVLTLVLIAIAGVFFRLQGQNPSPQTPAATRSVWGGIYTDKQAQRGEALYQQQCALCHGAKLIGKASDATPPLAGRTFMDSWNGRSLDGLFKQIQRKMPQDDPGTLTPQQTADLVAFILSFNKFPAGQTELSTESESLATVRFEAKKPDEK